MTARTTKVASPGRWRRGLGASGKVSLIKKTNEIIVIEPCRSERALTGFWFLLGA